MDVSDWFGRSETADDVLHPRPAAALAAAPDQPPRPWADGAALPPMPAGLPAPR